MISVTLIVQINIYQEIVLSKKVVGLWNNLSECVLLSLDEDTFKKQLIVLNL